jgi:hypothetical protein
MYRTTSSAILVEIAISAYYDIYSFSGPKTNLVHRRVRTWTARSPILVELAQSPWKSTA